MADESSQPDAQVDAPSELRLGAILVEVWLGKFGAYPAATVEGLSEFEAVGYLRPVLAELEDGARDFTAVIVQRGDLDEEEPEEDDDEVSA